MNRILGLLALGVVLVAVLVALFLAGKPKVVVGSKAFAESWILGQALTDLANRAGDGGVKHVSNLGGTDIVYQALKAGRVDVYPEYTGTITESILKTHERMSVPQIRQALEAQGLSISDSLGFNDGYGLAVTGEIQARLGLRKISDLAAHPELHLAFSHEFLER